MARRLCLLTALAVLALPLAEGAALAEVDRRAGAGLAKLMMGDCRGARRDLKSMVADSSASAIDTLSLAAFVINACEPPARQPQAIRQTLAAVEPRAPNDWEVAQLAILLASFSPDTADAARRLKALPARFPDRMPEFDVTDLDQLLGKIAGQRGQAEADSIRLGLFRAGAGTGTSQLLGDRDELLREGALLALQKGETDLARRLAGELVHPLELLHLLINRDYQPLWAETEARVGDGMAAATSHGLEAARDFEEAIGQDDPRRTDARTNLILALWASGAREEALDLAASFAPRPSDLARLDADGLMLVDAHAKMLVASGRVDEADARYRALTSALAAKPELVDSTLYHHFQMLSREGRHEQALALLNGWRERPEGQKLSLGTTGVLRAEICSKVALGQQQGLDQLKQELLARAGTDTTSQTIEALICLGDMEAAETRLLAMLADPGRREWALYVFQPEAARALKDPCSWSVRALLDRPAVKAAFAERGRELPVRFWPRGERGQYAGHGAAAAGPGRL